MSSFSGRSNNFLLLILMSSYSWKLIYTILPKFGSKNVELFKLKKVAPGETGECKLAEY